ncbi:SDR family oxidoreductase [Lutibacter sp. HS1-25]|uniref:SDR family oxidoreductase n=1 Tax=Lutibacter sp. HS1-25 TaxID=2485000 RepID=UPI00101314E5|nr:SDR family oxidoreductase [Lutibacter sp. HS1-25]RXP45411.1 SDR family oxidoreductase [Lutibacter sp. HS1-25]
MNILLTGVSKGLGLYIAMELLDKGHVVYGLSRTNTEELKALKKVHTKNLNLLQYDLSDYDNIQKVIFKTFLRNVQLHGFINNAAIAYDDIITNAKIERINEMFRVNVYSPINITKYAIRNMILNKISGTIIHISSISVHTGYKGLSMYAASKGALEAFSKNTAREWGSLGIRSNCIVSGFMDTEMSSSLSDEQKNRIYNRTSQKKAVDPKSIASTIEFLITDNACSITGQNIFVDSGTI